MSPVRMNSIKRKKDTPTGQDAEQGENIVTAGEV